MDPNRNFENTQSEGKGDVDIRLYEDSECLGTIRIAGLGADEWCDLEADVWDGRNAEGEH